MHLYFFIKPIDNIPYLYLFQRSSKTKFGGLYAFPGGKKETQDSDFLTLAEKLWEEERDPWASSILSLFKFPDITLRITCLREVYEEISILPCYKNNTYTVLSRLDSVDAPSDFFSLCRFKNIIPAVDRLKGWKRIAPPHYHSFQVINTLIKLMLSVK